MSVGFDEADLIASTTRESFFQFFLEFWDVLIHENLELNWHIEYLCNQLQMGAERVFAGLPKKYDLLINVPPGTTKSTICSIMFPAWCFTRMPTARFICVSHTDSLVLDLSRKCRDLVRSEKYQECFGVARKYKGRTCKPVLIRDDQDTKGYWATSEGGFRYCATVGGKSPMGMHAHFLLTDDPIDPKKITSETELKEANRYMTETLPSRKVNKAVTWSVLIMQRLHQDDPTGSRLANTKAGKVKHICLPAEISDKVKPSYLQEYYEDGLLDPLRLSKEVLQEALGEHGSFAYAGQFSQDPIPLGGGMFKVAKINYDTPPNSFRMVVRYWDTAGSLKGAYTCGVKMAKDNQGRIWILHVKRGRWAPEEREAIIKQTAMMDGKKVRIYIEQQGGSSGKEVVQDSIKKLSGFSAFPDKPTGDKVHRAEPFAGQMNIGNVYLPLATEWVSDYIDELQYAPFSKFKDQMDASSGAFKFINTRVVIGGWRGF